MLEVRRAGDRFCTRTEWLTSWHSFSYGPWYDPDNVGFGPLVVSNHDVLAPGAGFDDHRHSGVALVTYVVSGALRHRDSAGHDAVVEAGQVQALYSGVGVSHSERNASSDEPVEYVQLWVRTERSEVVYERPQPASHWGGLAERSGDLTVQSLPERALTPVAEGAARYWYVVEGAVRTTDGTQLAVGDAVSGDGNLRLIATRPSVVVRFTLWPEGPS